MSKFANFLKPIAQGLVDAALPTIKAELQSLLTAAVARDQRVPSAAKLVFVSVISAALDGWTVKL